MAYPMSSLKPYEVGTLVHIVWRRELSLRRVRKLVVEPGLKCRLSKSQLRILSVYFGLSNLV